MFLFNMKRWLEAFLPPAVQSWPLDNAIQAQALSGILTEEGIPHRIRRNGEALWAFTDRAHEGWGRLETEDAFVDQVDQLYRDFQDSKPEDSSSPEE